MIDLILNLNAGRSAAPLSAIETAIRDADATLHATDSLQALDRVVQQHLHNDAQTIAIWGGDGTITATLSALFAANPDRRWPPICLLPGGTINAVARCLGVRGTPLAALKRLLKRAPASSVSRDTLLVRPDPSARAQLGFLFGVGLIPNFVQVYKSSSNRGPVQAALRMAQAATGVFRAAEHDPFFKLMNAQIWAGDALWTEGAFTNISAGTIRCLPLGFPAYTRALEKPGSFHLVAHRLRAGGALLELPRIKMGRGMKRAQQDVFSQVRIRAESPLTFSLDGDNDHCGHELALSTGPRLDFVVP